MRGNELRVPTLHQFSLIGTIYWVFPILEKLRTQASITVCVLGGSLMEAAVLTDEASIPVAPERPFGKGAVLGLRRVEQARARKEDRKSVV